MVPLVADTTGLDPLVLVLFSALTGGAGFVARQWIKDRDYERQICRDDKAALQSKLDAYEARAYRIAELTQPAEVAHTDPQARAEPSRRDSARIRPRGDRDA